MPEASRSADDSIFSLPIHYVMIDGEAPRAKTRGTGNLLGHRRSMAELLDDLTFRLRPPDGADGPVGHQSGLGPALVGVETDLRLPLIADLAQ